VLEAGGVDVANTDLNTDANADVSAQLADLLQFKAQVMLYGRYGGGALAVLALLWVVAKLLGCCRKAPSKRRKGRDAGKEGREDDDFEAREGPSEESARRPYLEPPQMRSSEAARAPRPFDVSDGRATKRNVGRGHD